MAVYGVRKGRIVGVYDTWEEAKAQVDGFAGAQYKKFKTREEAESYVGGSNISSKYVYAVKGLNEIFDSWEECSEVVTGHSYEYRKFKTKEDAKKWLDGASDEDYIGIEDRSLPTLYIDGSCRGGSSGIGFAVVLVQNGISTIYKGRTTGKQQNISGEIAAAAYAVRVLASQGVQEANIVYDLNTTYEWYVGSFKARSDEAKAYVRFMQSFTESKGLVLHWYNVKSHSGIVYNNEADRVAKQACINARHFALADLFSLDEDMFI